MKDMVEARMQLTYHTVPPSGSFIPSIGKKILNKEEKECKSNEAIQIGYSSE